MNRYAGNKVPQVVKTQNTRVPKHTTLYSSLIPYFLMGTVAGLGVFAARHPDAIDTYAAQARETMELYRAPYIPGVVDSDDIDATHQRLIDLGLVTVTKVPPGWKPGDPQ